jgi:ubiquinone/menaquinone biosynthesis C-methylase UbiE
MPTDYDAIAGQYQRAKRQTWRGHVEAFTFFGMLGDLSGKAAVDLACGEGHYTRMLPSLGAVKVIGVDSSEGMIALARAQESAHPLGIEYFVQDCRSLRLPNEFDVATAAYLLNYARSREDLAAMLQSIARCLRPGARFVTINSNPGVDFDRPEIYRKYGFEIRESVQPKEGMPYTWVFHLDEGPVEVENYWLPASAYEEALRSAGFLNVRWLQPRISPIAEVGHEPDYWRDFLDCPPVIGIECLRGNGGVRERPVQHACPGP